MQSSTNQKWSAGTEGGTSGNTGVQFTTGTDRLELSFSDFLKISCSLERILTEHVYTKASLDSKLQISSICPIRVRSRKRDIFKEMQQFDSNRR